MQHGITRITITDQLNGQGAWRFAAARAHQPAANELYRKIFAELGMPLAEGDYDWRVEKKEFIAGYDHLLGIDVIFTFQGGQEATLQEKFLNTNYNSVTVEYMQNPSTGEQGDWFKMKCDYYFVGYDQFRTNRFQSWILLNWPMTRQLTNQGKITWYDKQNTKDGARASFRYVHFNSLPECCIVHGFWQPRNIGGAMP